MIPLLLFHWSRDRLVSIDSFLPVNELRQREGLTTNTPINSAMGCFLSWNSEATAARLVCGAHFQRVDVQAMFKKQRNRQQPTTQLHSCSIKLDESEDYATITGFDNVPHFQQKDRTI